MNSNSAINLNQFLINAHSTLIEWPMSPPTLSRPKVNTTADQSKFIIDASCSLNGKVRFVPYSGHSE